MAVNRRTFIIRIWQSEAGSMTGQISDPQDGWRRPFRNAAELWRVLIADTAGLSLPGEASNTLPPNPTESDQEE